MEKGEWYKAFGEKETPSGETECYYHLLDIGESVRVRVYYYYPDLKHVKHLESTTEEYPVKWWLKQLAENNIHLIPKSELPFLLKF